jgi:phosphatidylglycerophosphate synthase
MFDAELRGVKKRALWPLTGRLGGVPPALITTVALAAGVSSALFAAGGALAAALGFWLVNRLLDGLDGEVARFRDGQSDLGGYYDLLADLFVYAALPIGLARWQQEPAVWAALSLMLAAFYVNAGSWMLLALILAKRRTAVASAPSVTSFAMPRGLIEGAETLVLFTLFILFPGHLPFLFAATALLVGVTALQRGVWAFRTLRAERPVDAENL